MKRLLTVLLTNLLVCVFICAQEPGYHPFVERGKQWHVHGFNWSQNIVIDYYFSDGKEVLERDGHCYEQLRAKADDGSENFIAWLREENKRVYLYDEKEGKEVLTYDFSLEEGDMFEPEYGNLHNCVVTKVDTISLNGQRLKTITIKAIDGAYVNEVWTETEWIEGIGALKSNPLDGLYSSGKHTDANASYVAYVSGNVYLPISFNDSIFGWWGQNLLKGCEVETDDLLDDLHYELVSDPANNTYTFHAYGTMWIPNDDNNYIYCKRVYNAEDGAFNLYLQKTHIGQNTDLMVPYSVDIYFPCFKTGYKYIAVDKRGKHPVAVRQASYRTFIEEGKVWKVGWFYPQTSTSKVDYYYFDGDSVTIDGKICLTMQCRHEAADESGIREPWTEYVGAIYEDNQRVYCLFPDEQDFKLLYDFESNIGDTIEVYGGVAANQYPMESCIISAREYVSNEFFKGNTTSVVVKQPTWFELAQVYADAYDYNRPCLWIEAIGTPSPYLFRNMEGDGEYYWLMSCTVNDEVLYHNPDLIDGVTPQDLDVKKQWLDFTHVVKPRPKAPLKTSSAVHVSERQEDGLTGECSSKDLFVNLNTLSGQYTITIADAAGQEVYRKEVQTSNVVAINTDISAYNKGIYTLTIENDDESYSATFCINGETAIRDINTSEMGNGNSVNDRCYDLAGRRISPNKLLHSAGKGIYIRDGKKVVR